MDKLLFLLLLTFSQGSLACHFVGVHENRDSLNQTIKHYKLGDKIEDFKLLNYDGKYVHLSDFKKEKGVIIIFMRITCEYCEAYESRIMALDKKYKDLGFRVWAISPFGDNSKIHPLDDIPHMKIKALKMGYTFPFCTDDDFKITNAFHDEYTPTAYILENQHDNFYLKYIGDIDSDWTNKKPNKIKYVENRVDSILTARKNRSFPSR